MLITIKYFGQIAEATQTQEEQLDLPQHSIGDLLTVLYSKYNGLQLKDFKIAQNQKLVGLDTQLTGEDIALLPPFSGG